MKRLIYLNLVTPILLQFVLGIIRFLVSPAIYSLILGLTIWIILPLILLLLNLFIFLSKAEPSFLKCCLFMFLGLLLGDIAGYIIWGITTKQLLRPDGETIDIFRELTVYYFCLSAIIFIAVNIIKLINKTVRKLFR